MFYQDILFLHEASPPRGQSADLSKVVSQEIKIGKFLFSNFSVVLSLQQYESTTPFLVYRLFL